MKIKNNSIYNVDSYKAIKDIPDNSIDCIYTDIPYLYANGAGGSSELAQRIAKNSDDISHISNGIDYQIFEDFQRVMKKVNIVIWCSKLQILDMLNYWCSIPNVTFEPLLWCKTNPTPNCNGKWLSDVEYAFHFKEKGVKLNDGYELKSKFYVSPLNVKDKKKYDHPTIKPLELVKRHLLHITQPNDVVFDPFLGSGTTAVACQDIGRQFLGFEYSQEYFTTAQERLEANANNIIEELI